jgi:hypothetical protein
LQDFFADPLDLCNGTFQSGSKIELIYMKARFAATASGQECSGLITENPSSRATSQSIASAATK